MSSFQWELVVVGGLAVAAWVGVFVQAVCIRKRGE